MQARHSINDVCCIMTDRAVLCCAVLSCTVLYLQHAGCKAVGAVALLYSQVQHCKDNVTSKLGGSVSPVLVGQTVKQKAYLPT
jgi:hypothetical protein